MTTMPQPADPTQSYTATYDAWNRLVKLEQPATPSPETVAAYAYDGAKRRIVQQSYTSGTLSETRHLYYTQPSQWQVVEERVGTSPDAADAERQFVWGLRYIDDCVLRDRDTNANGTLDERLYAMQDANWNVTGLSDSSGSIQERYVYSAYGLPVWLSAAFVPQSAAFDWESLYCGYRYESGVGLFHVRNRIYHSILGTWAQRDPVGLAAGVNLYSYCDESSLSRTDPHGLWYWWVIVLLAILALACIACAIFVVWDTINHLAWCATLWPVPPSGNLPAYLRCALSPFAPGSPPPVFPNASWCACLVCGTGLIIAGCVTGVIPAPICGLIGLGS